MVQQREDCCMSTSHATNSQATTSLRFRTADFFKMDLRRAVSMNVPRDCNPLHRTLTSPCGVEIWETNEKMCFALWELMARS
jgi:hypothetical protein